MIIACFIKLNPCQRSNLKFQICSMHRIMKRIHIRVRSTQILDIGGFRHWVHTQLRLNISPQKLNYFRWSSSDLNSTQKYSSVQVSEFRKQIFERVISISVLMLPNISRKRVNYGGCPQIPNPKNRYSISKQSHTRDGAKKSLFRGAVNQNANKFT